MRFVNVAVRCSSVVLCVVAAVCFHSAAPAAACSLDGVPSLEIDGQRAQFNNHPPSARDWQSWAQFVSPRPVAAYAPVRIWEVRSLVALPAEAFVHAWRWNFGDGTGAVVGGTAVVHQFSRHGTFRVTVDAYLASRHTWLNFDALQLQVR